MKSFHPSTRRLLVVTLWSAGFFLLFWTLNSSNPFYPERKLKLVGRASQIEAIDIKYDFGDGFKSFQKEQRKVSIDSDGQFSVTLTLPGLSIRQLKVEPSSENSVLTELSGSVVSGEGEQRASEVTQNTDGSWSLSLQGLLHHTFSPLLGIIHAFLAALVLTLVWALSRLRSWLGVPSMREVLSKIFIEENRYRFWAMMVIAVSVHSIWLVGYWPASMTNDSWASLNEIQTLKISDWHPYPYTVWLLGITHLFGSVAAVPLIQILITSATVSWILFFAWERGAPRVVVFFFFLCFLFSIPIGLMNTILWKDVPFSIGLLILSFIFFKAQYVRQAEGRLLSIRGWHWILFGALCVVVCHFRHNGVLFYGVIPLFAYKRVSNKDFGRLLLTLGTVFLAFNYLFPALLGIQRTSASPQQQYRTVLAIMTHFNYYSRDRDKDRLIVEDATKMSWEEITALYPRDWFNAWDRSEIQRRQFEPTYGHTAEYNKSFVARLVLENLPIVLASRTYEFFHSIGIDQSSSDATINFYQNPCQLFGTNLSPPGRFLFQVPIEARPPSPWLRAQLESLATWSMKYEGFFSRQVFFWSLLPFFLIFALILFFEGGLSPTGLFTVPSLVTAGAVFLSGAGESWRYFYYVLLCGLVVLPLAICCRLNVKRGVSQ